MGGIVIYAGEAKELNILIEGEKITGLVSCGVSVSADQTIDASGQFILPCAIDGHTHFEVSLKRFIVTFFTHYSLPFMFAFKLNAVKVQ
jgi:adenine deaminase